MKIYNTLTRKKQLFNPINPPKIGMYVCGPTVYDYSHIGHAKSYIQFDVIARYLRYKGFDVNYIVNITDIDDKIINQANKEKKESKDISSFYESAYIEDMHALNVNTVNKYVRVTDHLKEIINQINELNKKGIAYELDDGIYFDVSKFKKYGRLSRQDLEQLNSHRIEPNPNKKNISDFALWKKQKQGEPAWDSPLGKGRPGWHIECSAMSTKYLGNSFDIHGGGSDLIFPHHEAEIAQVEAVTKKPFAKFWLHNGFLVINKEKMSKSLANFITIRDALKKWGPMPIRFLFATSHYRAQMDFSDEALNSAKAGFESLKNTFIGLRSRMFSEGDIDSSFIKKIEALKKKFIKEMDDDFSTPKATAIVFEVSRAINNYRGTKCTAEESAEQLNCMMEVLGITVLGQEEIPKEVRELANLREKARNDKNWQDADIIRGKISKLGYRVDDTHKGQVIIKQ